MCVCLLYYFQTHFCRLFTVTIKEAYYATYFIIVHCEHNIKRAKAIFVLTFTSWSTLGTPPPYLSRPHPETVAIFPVNSAPSGGIQIGTEKRVHENIFSGIFFLEIKDDNARMCSLISRKKIEFSIFPLTYIKKRWASSSINIECLSNIDDVDDCLKGFPDKK